MSVDHHRRIYRLVDDHLKQLAMGEPYGLIVEFSYAPKIGGGGQFEGFMPGWVVAVTLKSKLLGQPDVEDGVVIYGLLPPDDALRQHTGAVLEAVRAKRDQQLAPIASGEDIMAAMRGGQ